MVDVVELAYKPVDLFDKEQKKVLSENNQICIVADKLPIKKGEFGLMVFDDLFDSEYKQVEDSLPDIAIIHSDGDHIIEGQNCFLVQCFIK